MTHRAVRGTSTPKLPFGQPETGLESERTMDDHKNDLDLDNQSAEERPREEGGFGHRVIPDIVRKALMTGVGTVLLGQEGVRTAIGDLKLPKEAMEYVVSQAERTKREVIHSLARELRQFLDGLELQELIGRSLEGTTFEIHTTIRVTQNESGQLGTQVLGKSGQMVRANDDKNEDKGSKGASKAKAEPKKRRSTKKS